MEDVALALAAFPVMRVERFVPIPTGSLMVFHAGRPIRAVREAAHYRANPAMDTEEFRKNNWKSDSLATGLARVSLNPRAVVLYLADPLDPSEPVDRVADQLRELAAHRCGSATGAGVSRIVVGEWPEGWPTLRVTEYLSLSGSVTLPVFDGSAYVGCSATSR